MSAAEEVVTEAPAVEAVPKRAMTLGLGTSLVVLAATLPHFGIPDEGMLLVLAVDQFLDMGRSATNVVGNSIASSVVAKWEGELTAPLDEPKAPQLR